MAKPNDLTSPPNLAGMPPGVPYIIGNEAAERFSYYGMKSVLTVFMAHYILNQSGLLAPMSSNEAYMYTHYFVFGVYFLPILGAVIADGWLGTSFVPERADAYLSHLDAGLGELAANADDELIVLREAGQRIDALVGRDRLLHQRALDLEVFLRLRQSLVVGLGKTTVVLRSG